jgi:predicted nucleotidyltransferase
LGDDVLNKKIKTELDNIVSALVDTGDVSQIFLFGSHASGEETADSDIDLCVLTPIKGKDPIDIAVDFRLKTWDVRKTPMDLLAYNEDKFYDNVSKHPKSFEHDIAKNGVLLYGQRQS